jgi:hypothetical protein
MSRVLLYAIISGFSFRCSRKFQKIHYDIQTLNLIFGGPKLAYAMLKALDLPSVRATQTHSTRPQIQACIGFPTMREIVYNLDALHKAQTLWREGVAPPKWGYCLLIDELALEERPRYDASQDAVIGMARENASTCDLSPVTLDTLYAIADGLNEQPEETISWAKEATVVTLAAFDRDHYSPVPLLISGTNKKETEKPQAQWIQLLLDAWDKSSNGSSFYGELWAVASDGDATWRKALHGLFMCEYLDKDDPLHSLLVGLPLMNMQCGKRARNLDIDFKHKFKSTTYNCYCKLPMLIIIADFATLLRGVDGILVAGDHITPALLKMKMKTHLKIDKDNLDTLFNLKDHQNVPKAVELLTALYHLATLQSSDTMDNCSLVILGCFIGFLVKPYTDLSMSLMDQLISLSAAGHLLLVLYCHNHTSFCPGQFYYDAQSLIKATYWHVAKQKVLDPAGSFYIIQTGSD